MDIGAALKNASYETILPSGKHLSVIDLNNARRIADETQAPLGEIYRLALRHSICPLCYIRNIGVITLFEQLKLMDSRIAIVGAGGLGGAAVGILARMGIGHLTIIDKDRFEESNLNRQMFCIEANIGEYKAEAAARDLLKINPAVALKSIAQEITAECAASMLDGVDLVIDALDNSSARLIVAAAAREMNIPFIHGAAAGFIGQAASILPAGAIAIEEICPEGPRFEAPSVLSFTPMITASLQAAEAVKILLGKDAALRDSLIHFDWLKETFKSARW